MTKKPTSLHAPSDAVLVAPLPSAGGAYVFDGTALRPEADVAAEAVAASDADPQGSEAE